MHVREDEGEVPAEIGHGGRDLHGLFLVEGVVRVRVIAVWAAALRTHR